MRQWLQITSGRGPAECGWVVAQLTQHILEEAARSIDQAQKARWSLHNALKRGDPVRVYEGVNFKQRGPDASRNP